MLSGVNHLCVKCSEKCKQWSEVVIYRCPNYRYADSIGGKQGKEAQGSTNSGKMTKVL